jgi:anti-sigma B factor antagonist
MKIRREDRGAVAILRVSGTIMGGPDADAFHGAVRGAQAEGRRHLLVDLGEVSWVNSSGLGILIASFTRVRREKGVLKLLNVSRRIESILMVTKLNTFFESFQDETRAIRSFGPE